MIIFRHLPPVERHQVVLCCFFMCVCVGMEGGFSVSSTSRGVFPAKEAEILYCYRTKYARSRVQAYCGLCVIT